MVVRLTVIAGTGAANGSASNWRRRCAAVPFEEHPGRITCNRYC